MYHTDEILSERSESTDWDTFIRSWLLCGPFPNPSGGRSNSVHHTQFDVDFLQAVGGEENPWIHEGLVVVYPGGSATWRLYKEKGHFIDLDSAISEKEALLAYAYCEIESSCTQACFLGWGSNDGGRLWLNGELIWDRPKGRPLHVDDDLIPIVLQEGRNTLLVKIEERARQ